MAPKPILRREVLNWIEEIAESDKSTTINFITGNPDAKSDYTIADIIQEIRKGTPFGKQQYRVAERLYRDSLKDTQRFFCISGYVGGSAGTDVSQPEAVAVTLQIPHGRRTVPFETEFSGNLYSKFKSWGIIYEDAPFRIDFYVDGRIDVVPKNASDKKIKTLGREFKRLQKLEDAMIKEALHKKPKN